MMSLVLVSHSEKLAEGLGELLQQMVNQEDYVLIQPVGGTGDGRLGTNALMILLALEKAQKLEHTFVFCDIGSAFLSAEAALELLAKEWQSKVTILDQVPFVEGAFVAAVGASIGHSREQIQQSLAKLVKEMAENEVA